jgi:PAS domain S-box-containing protein
MLTQPSHTVLIIDDADHDREAYRRFLMGEQTCRYRILEKESAEDALALCREFSLDPSSATESLIDAILLDYRLPDKDGLEVLADLRVVLGENCPPVVLITGQGSEAIAVQAFKHGIEDYLIKSEITPETLRVAIRMAIKNAELRRKLRESEARYQAVVHDQTELIRRLHLEDSQRFLQEIAETIPGILYVYDLILQRNVFVNRQIAELLGYSREQVQTMGASLLPTLFHPDDFARVPERLAQFDAAPNGTVLEWEYRMQHANGEWHWFCGRETVFERTAEGRVKQILGIAEDITPRKFVALALSQANERFELATAAVNGLIYDYDLQRNYVDRSQGLTTLFGYTLDEAEPTAKWWHNLIHPDDLNAINWDTVDEQLATLDRISGEYRVRHKDGHYVWVEERSFVIRNEAGQPVRMVGCTTDISDRKHLEQERELLLARTQAAREDAEQANRAKDEFLAIVSHELRSPLNAILGWAGLLRNRQLSPEQVEQALATIERNARSQNQLIEDLLDVSRIIRGTLPLTLTDVNLGTVVETTVQNVQLSAELKQIDLRTTLDRSISTIMGDENRLRQIVTNLLTNAIKFTPTGGQVDVELSVIDSNAQLIVRDTGKGIAPDFLPYVFDQFRQANSQEGLGLGLAIVRHLVERHGGTVTAESPGVGQGATFTVRFPLQSEPTNEHPSVDSGSVCLVGAKILAVDDDPDTLLFIQFALEAEGAEVSIAQSAQQAIESFADVQPDLVISDIGMPHQDGYTLIRTLHQLSPDIPAIALTAYAKPEDCDCALAAGFQVHLKKPIDPDDLIAVIKENLCRERSEPEVNPAKRRS